MVVVGIAGGVTLDANIGDIIVPEVVVDGATGKEYEPDLIGDIEPRGRLISSDELLVGPEKFVQMRADGVVALDMVGVPGSSGLVASQFNLCIGFMRFL